MSKYSAMSSTEIALREITEQFVKDVQFAGAEKTVLAVLWLMNCEGQHNRDARLAFMAGLSAVLKSGEGG